MVQAGCGPFALVGLSLHDAGLCPIPCGGADGKTPKIATARWTRRPARSEVQRWGADSRFAECDVGILTGFSGVTVVDVDAHEDLKPLLAIFGTTPLQIATPSGGAHLYYQASGEGCANLRRLGFRADLKGAGGFIVAPPSIRRCGSAIGVPYVFEKGDWGSLTDLPPLSPGALDRLREAEAPIRAPCQSATGLSRVGAERSLHQMGGRNDALFRDFLRIAKGCLSLDDLLSEAGAQNQITCDPPLPDDEVMRTARSAWRYAVEGRNFAVGGGFACSYAVIDRIADPDALWLYMALKRAHPQGYVDGYTFALSPRAMSGHKCVGPLRERVLRQARDILVAADVLRCVHRGGRCKGDPSLYAFTNGNN